MHVSLLEVKTEIQRAPRTLAAESAFLGDSNQGHGLQPVGFQLTAKAC
jgi:hypothetical protein